MRKLKIDRNFNQLHYLGTVNFKQKYVSVSRVLAYNERCPGIESHIGDFDFFFRDNICSKVT